MAPSIQGQLLPPGSLVLVTGGNGYIASHIVDELLQYGYNVRATVRSTSRASWMTLLFTQRYPDSKLEIVEVPDISKPGCYDAAMKGVSAVIHSASDVRFTTDKAIITSAINCALNALEAAKDANKRGDKIKRFVFTSSSWVAWFPKPNVEVELTQESFDSKSEELLADPNTPKEVLPFVMYAVSKKKAEQEAWKWISEHKDCGFTFNTVLPSTTFGPPVDPAAQPYPSTGGMVRACYEGGMKEVLQTMEPQQYIDVRDAARLHVAGVVLERVEGERIFGFVEPYSFIRISDVIEREMGSKVPTEFKDKGEDLTKPVTREKSEEYLKRLGLPGWVPFEQSVKETIRSFYPKA